VQATNIPKNRDAARQVNARIGTVLLFLALCVGSAVGQEFVGFRYEGGKCVNDEGKEGRNPGYIGECGALRARDVRNANLDGVDLSGADMHALQGRSVNLKEAILVGAILRTAELESADLRGADLTGATMDRAKLRFADLSNANLTEARLDRANFEGALLRDANLSGADLRRADFRGADLNYADLTSANLRGAMYDARTIFPAYFTLQQAAMRGMVYRQ